MSSLIKKAIFPVAGLGTRSLPATKTVAKEMMPIVDKPLIQYAVEEAKEAGIEDFVFVTGRGKGMLDDYFDTAFELESALKTKGNFDLLDSVKDFIPPPGHLFYTRQQEPLGLGHAIWCARAVIGKAEPFAVILPDDLVLAEPGCMRQMINAHAKTGGMMLAVENVPRSVTNKYGIVDVEEDTDQIVKARGLVEKPQPADAPSTLAVIGRYILYPSIFDHLEKKEGGAGGEIQLTDAIMASSTEMPCYGFRFAGHRFDCGTKLGFVQANLAYGLVRDDLAAPLYSFLKTLEK